MEVKPLPAVPYIKIPDEESPILKAINVVPAVQHFWGESTCSKWS